MFTHLSDAITAIYLLIHLHAASQARTVDPERGYIALSSKGAMKQSSHRHSFVYLNRMT